MSAAHQKPEMRAFPPLYSLQPVADTKAKQCELWAGIILEKCQGKKQWAVEVEDEVFENKEIKRKMSAADAQVVLEQLVSDGKAVWIKGSKTKCWVLWRPLDDWASDIYTLADEEGHIGSVCTIYELSEDSAKGRSWEGMPEEMIKVIIACLQKQGKAELIEMDEDGDGVKFL
eukprot:TRINITY_DN38031_c0_g1_i1.p1 TRINITY_DN38031_c0_g1~~TRINITY_DN38031_c0_g1_i1.p1  ORF type:complete len:173 (+),score=31.88 TRINITY_DN38031_c0_g1_i1:42-560(+)